MDVLTSLEILISVALIGAFFQVSPGIFMLFYHYALAKYSKKTASNLSLFYLAGVETAILALFLIIYYVIFFLFFSISSYYSSLFTWIMSGILFALSIFCLIFYFKKGPSMSTFLPRRFASSLNSCAKSVKTRRDALLLGILSTLPELFLTIPLYTIFAVEIMRFNDFVFPRPLLVFLGLIISMSQLLIVRFLFRTSHNLAEIDRFRRKNKTFIKIMLSLLYFVLAILILAREL